ncbi:MAG: restriction endonuclease subunit S [Candidatus Scalindua sp.]|jgi:type I restriction enzyme, S subunit|nr:restriction endonuclease subunit S [Candidatus Scalindua sp.]MBT6045403.1 restriction endonuclease subunit S [Candidatus Scalindua sp.]MBT6231076.1 restriction endonuclease subunit S [Candidatus Scalindua sp.]MBT6564466.1 restriction endonuclease subunit S [Candidatus Scalindua sp.]
MPLLGGFVDIKTGKLDANASSVNGAYPFFTCSRQPLKIDEYAFNVDAILVAGNGDLNVKHYNGKFNAYQRTYVITVIKYDALDTRYLYHWMSKYVDRLRELSIGGVIKYIKLGMLTDAEIPLPPLEEQKRIAAILDKADALHRKREKSIALIDDLLRSVFLDMFGDPFTNPKGWKVEKLGNVCLKITDGVHQKPSYTDTGVPFISVKNITTGKLLFDDCKFISQEDHEKYYKRCNPEYLDVLYTKVGATYGRPAIVDTREEFSLYVSVALIKPDKESINPYFLKEALANPALKYQADRSIKGIGVPDLHLIEIKNFLMPLPPMKIQNQFVKRAEKIMQKSKKLNNALMYSQDIFASLTQSAFRGELTSQKEVA